MFQEIPKSPNEGTESEKSKSVRAEQELQMIAEHLEKGEWGDVAEELKELNVALVQGDVIEKKTFEELKAKIEAAGIPEEHKEDVERELGWIEDKFESQE